MKRISILLVTFAAILGIVATAATAGYWPSSGDTCSGGPIAAGTYGTFTVTGDCTVPTDATVNIRGNLIVAPGANLDAWSGSGTLNVTGSVWVGKGAVFGLGCSEAMIHDPGGALCSTPTQDVVGGSIIATGALTMYLDGNTIHGNIISIGGGPGPVFNPYVNFPIKDNTIGGNVLVQGWQGAWFGILRNTISGSVLVARNAGVAPSALGGPDSNEVAGNVVRNLACFGNSPAVGFYDSGAAPNVVSGLALGECGFNVTLPDLNYPNHDGKGSPQPISVKPA